MIPDNLPEAKRDSNGDLFKPLGAPEVLYLCYPHTDADGTPEIKGWLCLNGVEPIILTDPEAMKGESLEGMAEYCYLDGALDWWLVEPQRCACGQDCEGSHDSRSYGGAFCPTCDRELNDEVVFTHGIYECHDCTVTEGDCQD